MDECLNNLDTKYNRDFILKGEFDKVPYLKKMKVKDLPEKTLFLD